MRKSIEATVEKMLDGCGSWKPIFVATRELVKQAEGEEAPAECWGKWRQATPRSC